MDLLEFYLHQIIVFSIFYAGSSLVENIKG